MLDREKIRKYIVSRTTRGVRRDDILLKICEENGLSWQEAEALVDEFLAESSQEVSLRTNLIYGTIALVTFLVGLLLAIDNGYRLVTHLAVYSSTASSMEWYLILDLFLENYPLVVGLIIAVVLIVVGAWGLWRSGGDFFLSLFESDG